MICKEGVCCDTTASKFGWKNGAAAILEEIIDKDLIYLACRHHVYEIILAAAFTAKIPGTSGPNVSIFLRFQSQWPEIDKNSYKNGLHGLESSLKEQIPSTIQFIKEYLNSELPRSDYKELLQLSLVFLGVTENIKFRPPGACHHLAKAI